jgi:hypothetical protein
MEGKRLSAYLISTTCEPNPLWERDNFKRNDRRRKRQSADCETADWNNYLETIKSRSDTSRTGALWRQESPEQEVERQSCWEERKDAEYANEEQQIAECIHSCRGLCGYILCEQLVHVYNETSCEARRHISTDHQA